MKTLIKYYDKDILKNISAPLTLKPEKMIFFYDNGIQDMTWFHSLKKCFKHTMPNVIMEHISLDPMNYINKTMISYPNPIRPFNNPYQISVYSGMIFNGTI